MSIQILINSKLNAQGLEQTEKRLRDVKIALADMSDETVLGFDASSFQQFSEQGKRAITEQIQYLRQYSAELQKAAQGARALAGGDVASQAFLKRKQAIDQEIRSLQQMIPVEQQAALMAEKYAQSTNFSTEAIQKQIATLRQQQATLRNAAKVEFGKGNLEQAQILNNLAGQVKNTADSFEELTSKQEETDFATKIMNSSFNKLGFTLFVTLSTVQQVIGIFQQLWGTLEDGAAIFDRYESFNQNLNAVGISAGDMSRRLEEAGQGAVKMDTAMQGVLRLLKADLPAMANQADVLLKIATNAAIVEGDISDLDRIYETLITGIIRGEPRLIDNAGIILKVGKSVEEYAASLGKTTEQLTESEKAQAVFNAVVAKGDAIEAMADNLDSTALVLQQYKTDVNNAWDVIKAFFASVAVDALESQNSLKGAMQVFAESQGDVNGLDQRTRRLIQTFTSLKGLFVAITGGAIGIIEYFKGMKDAFKELQQNMAQDILVIANAWIRMKQAFFSGNFDQIQAEAQVAVDSVKDSINSAGDAFDDAGDRAANAMSEWEQRFGYGADAASEFATELDPAAQALAALGSQLDLISDKMEAAFDPLSDANISKELSEKRLDIENDFSEKMGDIREKLSEKLAKISEDLNGKLLEIARDRKDTLLKLAQDLAESQLEINEDLAEKLGDIETDASEKTQAAKEDANEKIQKNEEDHQRKLNDIQRKYELARLNALIDRDARALFEAEQNRKNDLKDAEETAKEKRDEVTTELEKELEDITKSQEKQRQDAIEAAEKRRADAINQYEKQRREAQQQYERARQEARQAAEKQRQDAIEAANKERRDAQEAYREKLQDLQKWHNDQLLRQKEAELKRLLARAKEYEKEGKLTQDHINELTRMWDEYNNMTESGGSASPVSYNGTDVGNLSGGTSSPGRRLTRLGGKWWWVYPDGSMTPASPTGDEISGRSERSDSSFSSMSAPMAQSVSINVTNDKTLEQIFKEMSYEAIVETVS